VRYRKLVERQKVKEVELIKVERGVCYISKLCSDCNLGKDLSKNEGDDQLIKYKDTGMYLLLYISIDYEKRKKASLKKQ